MAYAEHTRKIPVVPIVHAAQLDSVEALKYE